MYNGVKLGQVGSDIQAIRDITTSLRRATVLIAAERAGLKESLDEVGRISVGSANATWARLLKAGAILGVFQSDDQGFYSWSPDYQWVRQKATGWDQMISIIGHQLSYLNLVNGPEFWATNGGLSPAHQLAAEPARYEAFLAGVAASHRQHAAWLSELEEVKMCRCMADLGGGLGAYAEAWIAANDHRSAIIVDLPGVGEFLTDLLRRSGGRVRFLPADLKESFTIPGSVDFVLFANVLHLLPEWPALLQRVTQTLPHGCLLGIFEADPATPQGILFDLQVHLRSGCLTGLLHPANIANVLTDSHLRDTKCLTTFDADDPFERQYRLWIGKVERPENRRQGE